MKQIALLRGVNVGGKNKIIMEELRQLFGSIGLKNVESYIQSGNIVFESSDDEVTNGVKIEEAILKEFGLKIPAFVISEERLVNALEMNPFDTLEFKPSYLLFIFLDGAPNCQQMDQIATAKTDGELTEMINQVIYAYYPNGSGRSKLSLNLIESKLGVKATARNLTTIEKLVEMTKAGLYL